MSSHLYKDVFTLVCCLFCAVSISAQITNVDQLNNGEYMLFPHGQFEEGKAIAISYNEELGRESEISTSVNIGSYRRNPYWMRHSIWTFWADGNPNQFLICNGNNQFWAGGTKFVDDQQQAVSVTITKDDNRGMIIEGNYRNFADENGFDIYAVKDLIVEQDGIRYFIYNNSKTATVLSRDEYYSKEYSGDIVIPEKITVDGEEYVVTSIKEDAFHDCLELTSVTVPLSLRSIGNHCFDGCEKLTSFTCENNVCQIGTRAFYNCKSIVHIAFQNITELSDYTFNGCVSLRTIGFPKVRTIGDHTFAGCDSLQMINLPNVVTIGNDAFRDSKLQKIDIPNIERLGSGAFASTDIEEVELPATLRRYSAPCFKNVRLIVFNSQLPPTLTSTLSSGGIDSYFCKVPKSSVEAYRTADVWKTFSNRILPIGESVDYDVTTNAKESTSGLFGIIGQNNLGKVSKLKITGTINSYDIILIRNKMPYLTYLDLLDAKITSSSHEYYTGCHTEEDVVGKQMFYNMDNLLSLKLPKSATIIDISAVSACSKLKEVAIQGNIAKINANAFSACGRLSKIEFPEGLIEIGNNAFASCESVETVLLPNSIKTVGSSAFEFCSNLKSIQLPPSLREIGSYAFWGCYNLETIQLPGLKHIGSNAFDGCSKLEEVRLPSTLQSIGDEAFDCQNLKRVYTYTVEPVSISQNTFSNYASATLYRPIQARENYYWNTEWSQFGQSVDFDEPYKYFYVNKDYTLDERFDGNPDIDVNPGGGLELPDNDKGNQDADTIHIKGDGKNWASIIANGNLNAKGIYVDITIRANRWYFFSFPFRVKRANISCGAGARFVFRRYDGGLRAEHGHGGWIDVDSEYLEPWKGYIFQASIDCTLSVKIEKEQFGLLPKIDAKVDLEAHASANEQDASWNFVGNPFTSYYNINGMGYDCPITRWNSDTNSYEALRPGDDDYALHPFEAFFVQRPTDADQIGFSGDDRMTQIRSEKRAKAQAQMARVQGQFDLSRQIVNLTLSDGQTADKTRVVFNADKTQAYERDCDAAKFDATGASQLYTIEAQAGRMAINERPEGSVQIGFSADHAGDYVLSATRMDRPVLLRDNLLQTTYDLAQGDYHFSSEAGRFDHRFMLIIDKSATGIADIVKTTGVNVKPTDSGLNITHLEGHTLHVYGINGALYATRAADGFLTLAKGVYVVEVDGLKAKFMVK